MEAALDLVAVAAAAIQPHERDESPAGAATGPASEQFVWRQPIMRPAVTAKQVRGVCDVSRSPRTSACGARGSTLWSML